MIEIRNEIPTDVLRVVTGLAVAMACALMLATMGWATVFLVVALVASFGLWLTRAEWPSPQVLPVYIVALLLQMAHLAEEYRAGFYRLFPPTLGQPPWSARQFLFFNFAWLTAFVVGAIGLWRGWRPAIVVALFLAIGGGVANGIGHLLLAVNAGGYFPGLYTAPLMLLVGSVLLWQLFGSCDRSRFSREG